METFGGGDDQRISIEPEAHRCEGVPEMLMVERLQLGRGHDAVVNRGAGFVNCSGCMGCGLNPKDRADVKLRRSAGYREGLLLK